jgi:pimeloyl-ACP methyl ester carboxylesterase
MIVTIDKLKTYYETLGQGKPVVLLHGWGVDSAAMRPILKLLSGMENGYKAIALDLPGFGYSDTPAVPWGVNQYSDFLFAFFEAMNIRKAILIGHSFGGRITIKFAVEHPQAVDRIVLVDSAGILPKRGLCYYCKVYWFKLLKKIAGFLTGIGIGRGFFAKMSGKYGSDDYRNAGSMKDTFVKVVNQDLKSDLPHISTDTLLIWGENDKVTPLEDARIMKDLIRNSQLVFVPNAGHFCFLDNFPQFGKILVDYLGKD